ADPSSGSKTAPVATTAARPLLKANLAVMSLPSLALLWGACRPDTDMLMTGAAEHRLADRARQRGWRLDDAHDRQHEQQMDKIIGSEDAGPEHVGPLRWLGAQITERDHGEHEQPEEPPVERPVFGGANPRGVEPRNEAEQDDRGEHGDHAQQLVRDGA